ncbi:hypothetical protein [Chryseobacterium sp. JAH]|uniref:hypothetical protein n=1 Tax=Chryseobacterium sp. JAH TaxID=1742858 RepID=UPI00064671F1|nr:hypothetical protein [Chryseobacterium sp. JAH]KUJ52626.1 hypothetical protein AR685_06305 [Chryseobacterium sp. JAH]
MFTNITIIWIFYRKLLIPAVLFSVLLDLQLGLNFENFGLSFLVLLPVMHYFIYELRFKNEYIFYANFGFSRLFLWIFTLSFGLIIKIITIFL